MKIITNNNNNENIKIPSNLEFLSYGNGNSHPTDNYFVYDDNNLQIKSGDTFISWGNGCFWCINGHKYAVAYGSGTTNQVIDITALSYTINASNYCWVFKIK